MLNAKPCDDFQPVPIVDSHQVGSPYSLESIVVKRVTYIAETTWLQQKLIKIGPVLPVYLQIVDSRRGIERILVEKAVAYLVPVHTAGLQVQSRICSEVKAVGNIDIPRNIPVAVVLPAAIC